MLNVHEWRKDEWFSGWSGKGPKVEGQTLTLNDFLQKLESDGWEIFSVQQYARSLDCFIVSRKPR